MPKKNRRASETYNKDLDKENDKRNDSTHLQGTSSRSWSPPHSVEKTKTIENVLIPQGGGSLGAFGCGVFKALAKRNIKINIVAASRLT